MAKNKKTIIHEFDPCVYPRKMWVVKGGTIAGIKERFDGIADTDEDVEDAGATTFRVNKKSNGKAGYLVWFPNASDINRIDWIAHESTHVALEFFRDTGCKVDVDNQEPLAYLVDWVTECINIVRRTKDGSTESKSGDNEDADPQPRKEEENSHRNG